MRLKRWWVPAVVCLLALALAVGGWFAVRELRARQTVVTCGPFELNNTELAYYYWSEFFYYSGAYGDYLADAVDFSRPLSEQAYDEDNTWEDYLLQQALLTVRDTLSMAAKAEAEGYEMDESYLSTYRETLVHFASAAQEGGYDDLDGYLRASYGPYACRESFESYLYRSHLAASYADFLLAQCLPTDEACRAYFESRQAYYEECGADPDEEDTWLELVRQDLQSEQYQNAFLTITRQYEVRVDRDAVRLTPPRGLYERE